MAFAQWRYMATFISHSPSETEAFAETMARQVPGESVVGLVGDLGAGKTQFVKGFARGFGITERVLSPTFALLHLYTTGRMPLYHIDFYRLETVQQIIGAGLHEYFAPDGITIVEWWDRWTGNIPANFWLFTFETLNDTERRITYDAPGH